MIATSWLSHLKQRKIKENLWDQGTTDKIYFSKYAISPAVIVQKYAELFTLMIKEWNFARLLPSPRASFFDMEPAKIR